MSEPIQHQLKTRDGLDLTWFEWGVGARGNAPTIVLQHGFVASTSLNWIVPGIIDDFVATGRHVVALDARGHGHSDAPHDTEFYGERNMALDLHDLIDIVVAESGIAEVHVVGYAMGAIVCALAAVDDQRITRLILAAVGSGIVEFGGHDASAVPTEAIAEAFESANPDAIEHEGAQFYRTFADFVGADCAAMAAHARRRHAEPIALADIAATTMVVAGEGDPLAARPDVLAAALRNGELTVLDCGHFDMIGHPEFVAAMIRFLGQPSAPDELAVAAV